MSQATVTVRAHAAAGSDFSKLRLLLDGKVVGEAVVRGSTPTDTVFVLEDVDPTVAHRIGVEHYHDTTTRALTIESVTVAGTVIDASQGVQDVGPHDGRVLVAGDDAGRIVYNGTWEVDVPASVFRAGPTPDPEPEPDPDPVPDPDPTPDPGPDPDPDPGPTGEGGDTEIVLTLAAAPGSDFAKFRLLVDGALVGEARVTTASATELAFTVAGLDDGAPHEVAVEHYHDTAARALSILGVAINGTALDPADGAQDVGPRDGKTIWNGEAATTITFNGTWYVQVPAAVFGEAGPDPVPDPDPTPEPTPDPVPVGDYGALVAGLGGIAHWRFAETAGSQAADALGASDASLRGGVALGAAGLVGDDGAVRLDGQDDYLLVSSSGEPIRLMILGDSLSTATSPRMAASETLPGQLAPRLAEAGWNVELINLSKGGSTVVGGLDRLEAYLANGASPLPDAALVALGTNDSRSKLALDTVEARLHDIMDLLDQNEVATLLAGSRAQWPDGTHGYQTTAQAEAFMQIFEGEAAEHGAGYYPEILKAVFYAGVDTYTSDGVHPTPAGNALILDDLIDEIEALLAPFGKGDADSLALAQGTVSLWFAADDLNGKQGLLSKDASGYGGGGDVSLYLDGDQLVLRLQDGSSSHVLSSADGAVTAGEAHHVAFTFGAAGAALWLDGAEVARSAYTGGLESNGEPLVLGALAWTSARGTGDKITDAFDGRLDEVAIFDGQLTHEAVAMLAGLDEPTVV